MIKEDCIFCKLANGIIDTNTVYEDEELRIILDVAPAARGHALVLPKKHFADALEADMETLGKAMVAAARTGKALKEALGCDGINILQNNGEAAGQTVFHLHVHVIPRWNGDSVCFEYEKKNFTDEEFRETADLINKFM